MLYLTTTFYFRYNVVILLATYIFPIIAIGIITIHMTIVLWWRQPFSVVTPQLERAKSKKQKVMILSHTSSVERFSENFDDKVVTYRISLNNFLP
jgi:hypothetical protein